MRTMRNWTIAALIAALALSAAAGTAARDAAAQEAAEPAANVEVRVWQQVTDPLKLYISARYEGGSWATLGTRALDMSGLSSTGSYRHGDITVEVPLDGSGGPQTANAEVRVWQLRADPLKLYISARPEGGSWATLGTIPLEMPGLSSTGSYRYGDITVEVPLAAEPEATPDDTPAAEPAVARLRIPDLGVDSPIAVLGLLAGNVLDHPNDHEETGWYDLFDTPGTSGNAVFSAHVYYRNIPGPFERLTDLENGDEIVTVMSDGQEYRYRVFSVERHPLDTIPMRDILWPDARPLGAEWVTLITCGGEFEPYGRDASGALTGGYLSRDVVVARRIN